MADPSSGGGEGSSTSVDRMREHWRGFAREDAMHYIATNQESWESDDFYASGRSTAEDYLAVAGDGVERERMLEVGCGAGRLLVHFAEWFERADGIDIAPEMIETARAADLPANIHLTVGSGASLEPFDDGSFDLVISSHVFQHIPDRAVVGTYVQEVARVLKPGGRTVLHFDSRRRSFGRRLLLSLPDPLLPRDNRRYIRRYPVPREWPAEVARGAGLEVVTEREPGTERHLAVFARPA